MKFRKATSDFGSAKSIPNRNISQSQNRKMKVKKA